MLFAKSFFLGFMVALPVGPIAFLILERSLTAGRLAGVASSLGAAIADGLFGLLAAMGLAALLGEVGEARHLVRSVGGLGLAVVGAYLFFRAHPSLEPKEVLSPRYLHHYLWDAITTLLLTLTNPMTIIAFAFLFAGSDLIPADPRKLFYLEITAGIAGGSLCWWLILVAAAEPIRRRLSPLTVHRTLQIVGVVLVVLAGFTIGGRLKTLWQLVP